MIVPMKKVTVLVLENDRDAALEYLREIGVLHVEAERAAENEDVEAARKELEYVTRALEVLPAVSGKPPTDRGPKEIVADVWRILHEKKEAEEDLEGLRHEAARIGPFGDFDPAAIRALAERGVFVRLYRSSPKTPLAAPEGAHLTMLGRSRDAVFSTLVHRGPAPELEAKEERLPEISPAEIRSRIAELERKLGALDADLDRYAGDRPRVAAIVEEAEDRLRLAEARAAMAVAGGRILYLRGFCPANNVGCIREAARKAGWGVIDEEPGADDHAPTLLRTAAWVRRIQPLMQFVGILPGYREVDISAVFLLFFGLFFAILVGDAGYGAVFLGASLWARRKFPAAPRNVFALIDTMSVATIVWGALTGTWFGLQASAGNPVTRWLQNEDNLKWMCFLIAAIHLSLARVWTAVRMGRSLETLAQIGWLGSVWTMYFAANMMVLGADFPKAMIPVFAVSLALIILFMTPFRRIKSEWFNHVMLPLNLVGNFVDVVSYIRLFAVGAASYAVANNFNAMLAPMLGSWATGLVAAVFLFLAHALNVILALMGVMVHGVRLNTLEFSGHMGLQWTGVPYRPFRRSARAEEQES